MADTTNRIAGVCTLSIDGRPVALVGEAAYRCSNPTRETKMGADGFHGYKEKPGSGMMKGKIRDSGGLSVQSLGQLTNSTIVFQLANGKTVTGRNMFWSGDAPEADSEEAEIAFQFEGPDVTDAF
ncbi:MAG: phage tail tube protein [Pseudomonadota bacterium]